MLYFNKKTEYALIAILHMAKKSADSNITSAREIAEAYEVPYYLLAKVLQQLAGLGVIKAVHGTKGGYILAKRPQDITLADMLGVFEGHLGVAECFREEKITCRQWDGCTIKSPLYKLNHKIQTMLSQMTVEDLTK
ncbi:MAG: Rrf2 family transcriptional regulator [Deltaproteobacteria bacterium]|nr:Rrf2 family transcriptional regulator [Deltaproteobacteria bacterium]